MPAKRSLVLCSLIFALAACRREIPATDTATATTPAPQATDTTATTTTAAAQQLPACYPAITPGGPSVLPAATISGNIPLYVPLPSEINSPTQIRPYFDWFSWEA